VAKPAAPKSATPSTGSYVVVLDPGHQASSDQTPEPIGPGASETKPRVTGGATGVETGVPEYEVVLQVAMNVKRRLEAKGVKVVMTRTTNDVNLSNSERAAVANKNDADLFLRIHADGSPDRKVSGMSTLYPASNRWTKPIAAESKAAAGAVHSAMVDATGAVDRGTVARTDIAGFNWSEVPAILVEIGFLTHPVEDKLLVSPHYQDTVAEGIAAGTLAHLKQGG
jgi:N-acetylmuramoyl-L-alanine amidase